MINKPPRLNRDYNGDPDIKALKKEGVYKYGSSLDLRGKDTKKVGTTLISVSI